MELNVGAIKKRVSELERQDNLYGISKAEYAELGTLKALLVAFIVPSVETQRLTPSILSKEWGTRHPSAISTNIEAIWHFGTAQFFATPKNQVWKPIQNATQGDRQ